MDKLNSSPFVHIGEGEISNKRFILIYILEKEQERMSFLRGYYLVLLISQVPMFFFDNIEKIKVVQAGVCLMEQALSLCR